MADVAMPSSGGGTVVAGTYIGDGAKYRTVTLGFTPSAVIISASGRFTESSNAAHNALVIAGIPVPFGADVLAEIVSDGFKVCYTKYNSATNVEGETYYYLAFR